jgi:serralysin
MPTVSDIEVTALSSLNHIDALLDKGPDWNYLTPVGNTILYSFSVAAGNEAGQGGQQAFSAMQQSGARSAMKYISDLTGIQFTETVNGAAAQVHLCNIDIAGNNTTGLCSWTAKYGTLGSELVRYEPQAYVYLDNNEFGARNANLTPGDGGYETLLHELGHMMGLKHPFEGTVHLPAATDTTDYTLMSYTDAGGPHAQFSPYDIAALNWIYGGDGLRGALGINSATGARFITGSKNAETLAGTQFDDTLRGEEGNDMLNGGEGIDTAIFSGTRSSYTLTQLAGGGLLASGADGADTLNSIEILQFSDGKVSAQAVDTTPPIVPSMNVSKNAAGYVVGSTPFIFGIGEANSTVQVFSGAVLIGSATVDANGFWNLTTAPLADGVGYVVTAKGIDAAGNVSAASGGLTFNVDAHGPAVPTGTVGTDAAGQVAGNQPVFSGTGEAGTTLMLVNSDNAVIGKTTVGADGNWTITADPLSNGNYNVTVQSSDIADNATPAATPLGFTVSSALNRAGTAGNDTLTGSAGNNAIDGKDGIDTAVYAGAHAGYTVASSTNGFTVTAKSGSDGHDALINVERIHFSDSWVAIDVEGHGGQAYRVYRAAFDRAPDEVGVGFWLTKMDQGVSLQAVAGGFINSEEFGRVYGANPTTVTFVEKLYQNVLHRPLDEVGFDFWVNAIDHRGATRADVLAAFSESPENQAQVIGSIQGGFEYIPYTG